MLTLSTDILIFGGGVAGLWLLGELRRTGRQAILLENHALGHGQTVGSQGIIHGGLKYMLDGNLTASARAIADMPPLWRDCLSARRQPDLSAVTVRSDCCYLWGTASWKSKFFLTGAAHALKAAPTLVDPADPKLPPVLRSAASSVYRVPEQVIDTVALATVLAKAHESQIIATDPKSPPQFLRDPAGRVVAAHVRTADAQPLEIRLSSLVLTAGEGNTPLREILGLPLNLLQRRPLHMAMARGQSLPSLYGHCVDGRKPRLTITSQTDSQGRTVYLLGGELAESGVTQDADTLCAAARRELTTCVPALNLTGIEFASYAINRAEAATSTGQRPEDVHLLCEHNILTAFPTKLALAPRLSERVLESLPKSPPQTAPPASQPELPRPPVAPGPWETATHWRSA